MKSAFSIPSEINYLMRKKSNAFCADCLDSCALNVDIDNCIFLCNNCSEVHKELGFKIKNPIYDKFSSNEIENLQNADNELFNQNYLALYQQNSTQIPFGASYQDRKSFIVDKYANKKWFSKFPSKSNQSLYNHRHIEIQETDETDDTDDKKLFETTSESSEASDIPYPSDINYFGFSQKVNQVIDANADNEIFSNDLSEESQNEYENRNENEARCDDLGDDDSPKSLSDVTHGLRANKKKSIFDNDKLFGDDEDDESRASKSQRQILFDSNDSDQLFSGKSSKKSSGLFDDDSANNKRSRMPSGNRNAGSLFDVDNNNNADNLFSGKSSKKSSGLFDDDSANNKRSRMPSGNRNAGSLFDVDNNNNADNLFSGKSSKKSSGLFDDDSANNKRSRMPSGNTNTGSLFESIEPSIFDITPNKKRKYLLEQDVSLANDQSMIKCRNALINSENSDQNRSKISPSNNKAKDNIRNIIILCFVIAIVLAILFILKFKN